MKVYKMPSHYACPVNGCDGTLSVDLAAKSYGSVPTIYVYVCNKCGHRKSKPCEAEVKEMIKL